MNATTVKPLPSVKTATTAVKCTMAAEESYKVWYQMMREMADKDLKRQREVDQERQVFELAKNMLAKKSQELANAETEIKRLKHELHQSKANTRNVPKNMLDDALDALKRITEVDVSGRNAWTASNIMKKIAKEVLGDE